MERSEYDGKMAGIARRFLGMGLSASAGASRRRGRRQPGVDDGSAGEEVPVVQVTCTVPKPLSVFVRHA